MKLSKPVNVWPEDIDAEIRKHFLKEVTSPMMYESATKTFHPEGLYSELIFGQVGSPARIGTMAYIDLHCQVLEPIVYLNIIKLASWYQDLMESRAWAVWDPKLKDFTPCDKDDPDANTGFAFFLSHVKDIEYPFNSSRSRTNRIKTVQKFFAAGCGLRTKCLVVPAGWRDVKINESGRDEVDEVNKLYVSLLIMSREVKSDIMTPELIPFFDSAKYHIQLKVVEIFEYWKNFWEGKTGYGQSRYNKRMLALGTRNVIASATLQAESPDDPRYIKHNDTLTPLFIAAKMQEPIVVHALNRLFYSSIYTLGSVQIPAVDPKTLELVYIEVPASDVTYALGSKSKHDFINSFEDSTSRMQPVTVKDVNGKEYYLWMIYDLGDKVYLFRSLSDLERLLNYDPDHPENDADNAGVRVLDDNSTSIQTAPRQIQEVNREYCRPITKCEMLYIAVSGISKKYCTMTRYPAVEMGSIYPSRVVVATTLPSRSVKWKSQWDSRVEMILPHYPVLEATSYMEGTTIHPSKTPNLDADYDGDKLSQNGILTKEAIEETEGQLQSPLNIISPSGKFLDTLSTQTCRFVLSALTRIPEGAVVPTIED